MTRFRSRVLLAALLPALAGCATASGLPVARIAEPQIMAAYLPLSGHVHLGLDMAAGAAMVIAPGVAVTNAHNANLIDSGSVIGSVQDYDLLFFRTARAAPPPMGEPVVGAPVTAYGQGVAGALRMAHGTVRQTVTCPGCTAPAYFIFANPMRAADDAGPGFSGGPVVDAAGRLVGITFGYKDEAGQRRIYAYDMARVRTEYQRLAKPPAIRAN